MKVAVGLRVGPNKTNMRSESLSEALGDAGHSINTIGRGTPVPAHTDLYVQSGFAGSTALLSAIEQRIPYIIMEAPVFRSFDLETHSSWGYNGLQGGAWRPPTPSGSRDKPELQPLKDGGKQLIIGQKPTDHSLRGTDHVNWITEKRLLLPEADFRPHPLMVPPDYQETIEVALSRYGEVFTYSSTVGVDAVVAGCKAHADSERSLLRHYRGDRSEFLHELSWYGAAHSEYRELVPYILSGYDEAAGLMADGHCERPRGQVDGAQITRRYHKSIIC
jgi:hypothetical protein